MPKITRLHGLDHLRAVAIILVFFYHYSGIFGHPEWLWSVAKFGWTGVDLFFVLSGYLIASQLFSGIARGTGVGLKDFYIKRALRILPAYFVVLTLYFLFPMLRERESLAPLWKYLSFTQNIGLDLRTMGTFSHAWSLCIEEQFYFLLPIVLSGLLFMRVLTRAAVILPALMLAGIAVRWYSFNTHILPIQGSDSIWLVWYKHIYYPTWCRLDGLLVGISIAALYQYRQYLFNKASKYTMSMLIAGIITLTAAYFVCSNEISFTASVFGFPLVALGYGALVFSAVSPSGILYKWQSRITSTIATLSYAIYLSHKMVIHVTQSAISSIGLSKDGVAMMVCCIITTLIAAAVLNKVVERPFMLLRKRLL